MNVPSISNPPNAPKKKKPTLAFRREVVDRIPKLLLPEKEEATPNRPYWQILSESGYVREKYLRYTPEDIAEIDSVNLIKQIRRWYNPASQPRNDFESDYLRLILEAVDEHINAT